MGDPSISVEEWLANLPADLQLITKKLRAVALKTMPEAHEFIYHNAIGYSTSDSPFDRICYIAPQKKGYVNLGFFFGAGLPDPNTLLIGDGKRLRHVKIWSVNEAKDPALAKLIAATWNEAPESVARIHASRMKSKA